MQKQSLFFKNLQYRNEVIKSACHTVSGLFFEIPNMVTVYFGTFQNTKDDFIGTVYADGVHGGCEIEMRILA